MFDETLMLIFIVVILALYVYYSYSLQRIAEKTSTGNGWMAWVPILNVILMCRVARKSLWYFIGMLIPYVNVLVLMYIWGEMAGNLGRSKWIGILMIVPVANLAVPGYLAFTD